MYSTDIATLYVDTSVSANYLKKQIVQQNVVYLSLSITCVCVYVHGTAVERGLRRS